jgi:hypothetical protein
MSENEIRDGSGPGGGLRTGRVEGARPEEHRIVEERAAGREDAKQQKQDERAAKDGQVTESDLAELRRRLSKLEGDLRQFRITSSDPRIQVSGRFPHLTITVRQASS